MQAGKDERFRSTSKKKAVFSRFNFDMGNVGCNLFYGCKYTESLRVDFRPEAFIMSTMEQSIHGLFNDRKAQNIALTACSIAIGILLIQTFGKAYRPSGYDFTSYLLSAKALLSGHDPYHTGSGFPFIYPLFLLLVLIPLSFFPYWLNVLIWFGLNVFSLVLSVRILAANDKVRIDRSMYVPLAFLFFVFFSVVQNNLLNGQVNFVVLLFCMLFFKEYLSGKKVLAALFLAIAVSIKLMPTVLLVYLIVRNDYRSVLLSLGMTLVLCFLPALVLGWKTVSFFSGYLNSFILGQVAGNASAGNENIYFSLSGFCAHVFPWIGRIPGRNLIFACVVMAIAVIPDIWRKGKSLGKMGRWPLSMYLLTIPLISPVSEKHHLAFILPAICLNAVSLVSQGERFDYRKAMAFVVVLALYCTSRFYPAGPFFFFSIMVLLMLTAVSLFDGNSCESEIANG